MPEKKNTIVYRNVGFALLYLLFIFIICMFARILAGPDTVIGKYRTVFTLARGLDLFSDMFPAALIASILIPLGLRRPGTGFAVSGKEDRKRRNDYWKRYGRLPVREGFSAVAREIKGIPFYCFICMFVYTLLIFVIVPLLSGVESNMIYESRLFNEAFANVKNEIANSSDWTYASNELNVCEKIWPENKDVQALRQTIGISMPPEYFSKTAPIDTHSVLPFSAYTEGYFKTAPEKIENERIPLDAKGAIAASEKALKNERYYDADWLASLALRLAKPGSQEMAQAKALSARTFSMAGALKPDKAERTGLENYNLKAVCYNFLRAGRWIPAYYAALKALDAAKRSGYQDPDLDGFLAASLDGIRGTAFFQNEIDETGLESGSAASVAAGAGRNNAGARLDMNAVLSLPLDTQGARCVFRFAYLATWPDHAWARGVEFMAFDDKQNILCSMEAPFASLTPILNENSAGKPGGEQQVRVLTCALNRENFDARQEADWKWYGTEKIPALLNADTSAGNENSRPEQPQHFLLKTSYDDLRLALCESENTGNLPLTTLYNASHSLGKLGGASQAFTAEIIRRLLLVLSLLPLAIWMLSIGWTLRTRTLALSYLLMLILLPVIAWFATLLLKKATALISVWAALTWPLGGAVLFVIALSAVFYLAGVFLLLTRRM